MYLRRANAARLPRIDRSFNMIDVQTLVPRVTYSLLMVILEFDTTLSLSSLAFFAFERELGD